MVELSFNVDFPINTWSTQNNKQHVKSSLASNQQRMIGSRVTNYSGQSDYNGVVIIRLLESISAQYMYDSVTW